MLQCTFKIRTVVHHSSKRSRPGCCGQSHFPDPRTHSRTPGFPCPRTRIRGVSPSSIVSPQWSSQVRVAVAASSQFLLLFKCILLMNRKEVTITQQMPTQPPALAAIQVDAKSGEPIIRFGLQALLSGRIISRSVGTQGEPRWWHGMGGGISLAYLNNTTCATIAILRCHGAVIVIIMVTITTIVAATAASVVAAGGHPSRHLKCLNGPALELGWARGGDSTTCAWERSFGVYHIGVINSLNISRSKKKSP